MPAPRAKIPLFVRLRKVLLVVAVLLVVGLVALYRFGRAGLQAPPAGLPSEALESGEGETTTRSKGFDYTQYQDERRVFRVRGATYRADREGLAHLEDVNIELFRADGEAYQAVSRNATYNQAASSAILEGDVQLAGPGGLKLWTEKLTVGEEGERVVSPVPVRFEYRDGLVGSAERLRAEIPAQLFLLQGNLRIGTRPGSPVPMQLRADRGFLEQEERMLRAEGQVRLDRGPDWLECTRLSLYLAEDSDVLRFVRAKWAVLGELAGAGGGGAGTPAPVAFSASGLSGLFSEDGKELVHLELEGGSGQPTDLRTVDVATGHLRRITANFLTADLDAGRVAGAQASGQMRLVEYAGSEPTGELVREARAERAKATLGAAGALSIVDLEGAVDFREAAVRITSNQARADLDSGRAEFVGGPVQVVGESGELKAPRVIFERTGNRVRAREGVRAILSSADGVAVPGPLLQGGEGPVYIDAEEATWQRDSDAFTFRGGVRAWRGRDLLLAQEVRMERAADVLAASGGVKTVWHPEKPAAGSDTLEVDARSFEYRGADDRLVYEGNVRIDDGLRLMRCDLADIRLAETGGGMEHLECTGKARIEDRAQGRVVEGARAVYDPGSEVIEVYGDPVIMRDKKGSELKGRELIYRLAEGRVEFRAPAPAEEPEPVAEEPKP